MNRRTFTQAFSAAAVSAAFARLPAAQATTAVAHRNPPFPLSVMLFTVFNGLHFEERLAKIAEAGYQNVELVGEYRNWTEEKFVSANATRKRLGIRFDATGGLRHGFADPAARDALLAELREGLKPMETLGCPAMIVLSGNAIPALSREQQQQAAIETLKRTASMVEGRQIDGQPVRVLLECNDPEENPKCFLQSAADAIEIVRAVSHPQVQFLYDIFHEQVGFGNLIKKLEKYIDLIGLIHVADVPGRHEPGTGEINYASIYRKLVELKYNNVVAMEFQPIGDAVATLRAAKAIAVNAGII